MMAKTLKKDLRGENMKNAQTIDRVRYSGFTNFQQQTSLEELIAIFKARNVEIQISYDFKNTSSLDEKLLFLVDLLKLVDQKLSNSIKCIKFYPIAFNDGGSYFSFDVFSNFPVEKLKKITTEIDSEFILNQPINIQKNIIFNICSTR